LAPVVRLVRALEPSYVFWLPKSPMTGGAAVASAPGNAKSANKMIAERRELNIW
jgi:hypothetical protein